MDAGQLATPDGTSVQENVIVTGIVVLMPAALGAGEITYEITGGVLSMLTVAHAGSEELPAASTACPQ